MKLHLIFVPVFFVLASLFSIAVLRGGVPLVLVLLFQLMTVPLALDLSELMLAWFSNERDLPQREEVTRDVQVAVVFLVCDDLVPAALAALGNQTREVDYFILDDSTQPLDGTLGQKAQIVRRTSKGGNKAGNINNWLDRFGKKYEYFVVLDSDSIIPQDFVDRMLRYAEHPANGDVAVFNSLTVCWNVNSRFTADLAALAPVNNWIRLRIANKYSTVLSQGHNNLHRTSAVFAAGGFDERFVAEDIALTLALHKHGFRSKVVNVTSYEGEPEDISSHTRRLVRWAKQNIEIQQADWEQAHFDTKFQMFRLLAAYGSSFLIVTWSVIVAWIGNESAAQFGFKQLTWHNTSSWLAPWLIAAMLPILSMVARLPFLKQVGIPIRTYLRHFWLTQALVNATIFPLCWAQLCASSNPSLTFTVTPKTSAKRFERPIEAFGVHWHVLIFAAILLTGLGQAPIKLLFYAPYLLALIGAPMVIYHAMRAAPPSRRVPHG